MASAIAASSTVQATERESFLSNSSKCPVEIFNIRPARLSDIPKLAIHCHEAYLHEPIFRFLWPLAQKYPTDSILIFRRWVMRSYLGPQSICLVACHPSDRCTPIAHIQFDRLGNDAGAEKVARDRGLWEKSWLCILGWLFVAYNLLEDAIWPERIVDRERRMLHRRWCWEDDLKYWDHSRERKNRWHVKNIVVATQWQGKGVGKLLMREVMARAQREMVIVGLEANSKGEKLYRSLGFQMLGGYYKRVEGDDNGGGIMAWYPEGWTRAADDEEIDDVLIADELKRLRTKIIRGRVVNSALAGGVLVILLGALGIEAIFVSLGY